MNWKKEALERVSERLNLTAAEIAIRCGVARSTLFRWAKGEEDVNYESAVRIVIFLGEHDKLMGDQKKLEGLVCIDSVLSSLIDDPRVRSAAIQMLDVLIER